LRSSLIWESQCWEHNLFFDSAFEDLLSAELSTSYPSISPDATHSSSDEPVCIEAAPEKEAIESLDLTSEYAAYEPGLDLAFGVSPANGCSFGIGENLVPLLFPGSTYTTPNLAPSGGTRLPLEHDEDVFFSVLGSSMGQQSSPFTTGFAPQGDRSGFPCLPTSFRLPTDQLLPIVPGPSRVPLPRLSRLKCPLCPQAFSDKRQLNRHSSTHKSTRCDVDDCVAVLKDTRSLQRHKRTVHRDLFPGPQVACECGFRTPREDHYKRHLKTCQTERKMKRRKDSSDDARFFPE